MTSANTLPDDTETFDALLLERDAPLEHLQEIVDSQRAALTTRTAEIE